MIGYRVFTKIHRLSTGKIIGGAHMVLTAEEYLEFLHGSLPLPMEVDHMELVDVTPDVVYLPPPDPHQLGLDF